MSEALARNEVHEWYEFIDQPTDYLRVIESLEKLIADDASAFSLCRELIIRPADLEGYEGLPFSDIKLVETMEIDVKKAGIVESADDPVLAAKELLEGVDNPVHGLTIDENNLDGSDGLPEVHLSSKDPLIERRLSVDGRYGMISGVGIDVQTLQQADYELVTAVDMVTGLGDEDPERSMSTRYAVTTTDPSLNRYNLTNFWFVPDELKVTAYQWTEDDIGEITKSFKRVSYAVLVKLAGMIERT